MSLSVHSQVYFVLLECLFYQGKWDRKNATDSVYNVDYVIFGVFSYNIKNETLRCISKIFDPTPSVRKHKWVY